MASFSLHTGLKSQSGLRKSIYVIPKVGTNYSVHHRKQIIDNYTGTVAECVFDC